MDPAVTRGAEDRVITYSLPTDTAWVLPSLVIRHQLSAGHHDLSFVDLDHQALGPVSYTHPTLSNSEQEYLLLGSRQRKKKDNTAK